ncbi:winged helix DNA-binding domain-containing protein [Nocardioides coralli]|uniref:winged helix DNA-binding domain-containing protein n=1 Tax=Nocardioides coralli TaxID=2872154 RepID=UPI001CA46AA0|nr:winged helix DNA-binding domain-containing protein [Nocardioides coralli]QZY28264.1 winged helix DNA-binding domain-containing protein [Nocardioides coralli]
MRHVPDTERRARLARRHAVAPAHRVAGPVAATEAMVVLHATEPFGPYLSIAARTEDPGPDDVAAALYTDRTLVRQLAMRRTLFVFPRDLLPAALGSASARVAEQQRRLLVKELVRAGVTEDGEAWLVAAERAVLERLSDGSSMSATRLREEVPELAGRSRAVDGKKWSFATPFAPRVLTLLGARGDLVRTHNDGHWRTSRPTWARMEAWLGEAPEPWPEEKGYAELVRRWLSRFGPGTEADLVWWLGATKGAVRRALGDVGAVEVALDGGRTGYLLPDDLDPEPTVAPWAALLPVLDPTTMGWRDREFYLDPAHTPYLFDSNGNGGSTAWVDGRIVGCWVQDDAGAVEVFLREDVGADARGLLDAEAQRLTRWLDGVVISSVYRSALMKGQPLP